MRGLPDRRQVQHGDEHRELREAEPRADPQPARRAGGECRAEHERQGQVLEHVRGHRCSRRSRSGA